MEKTVAHATTERGTISPLAGQPAPKSILGDPGRLERAYYEGTPDVDDPSQLVIFGTSGHRGSPFSGAAHLNALVSEATEPVNCAIGGRP
jgi:hypothetical protein